MASQKYIDLMFSYDDTKMTEIDPEKINPFDPSTHDGDEDGETIEMENREMGTLITHHDHHNTHGTEKTSLDDSETDPLLPMERGRDEAWDRIKAKFPKCDPKKSTFTASIDEYGEVKVKLKRLGGRSYSLFVADGQLNEKLPKKN